MLSFDEVKKNAKLQKGRDEQEKESGSAKWEAVKQQARDYLISDAKSNAESVDKWFNSVKTVSDRIQQYYTQKGYVAPNNEFGTEVEKYLNQSGAVKSFISANKAAFDNYDELLKQYDDAVAHLNELKNATDQHNDFFSQFKDEEDYKFWDARSTPEKRLALYDENNRKIAALEAEREGMGFVMPFLDSDWDRANEIAAEIERLQTENLNYERGNYNENGIFYGSKRADDHYAVTQRPDFSITSAKRDYEYPKMDQYIREQDLGYLDQSKWYWENGVLYNADGEAQETDEFGNWIDPRNKDRVIEDRLGLFLSATEEQRLKAGAGEWGLNNVQKVFLDGMQRDWKYLTDDEIGIYYTYLDESQEKADQFLADMELELNRRRSLDEMGKWGEEYEKSNVFEKALLNAETVPMKLLSTIGGTVNNAANILQGKEINPYSTAHSGMHFAQTIRGKTTEDLDEMTGGWNVPVLDKVGVDISLGDLYQVGMSRLDSALATSLFQGGGTVLLGLGAAQEEAYRLYRQGASPEQVTLGAFSAGAAEAVFEYIGFDSLVKIKDVKTIGKLIKYALAQGGVEALEETGTELTNIFTNAVIMGQQSDLSALLEENNGDWGKVGLSLLQQATEAAFGGFLGGFGAGATAGGKSYAVSKANEIAQNAELGRTIRGAEGGVKALGDLALQVAGTTDGKVSRNLSRQAGKLSEKTSNAKVGKLYNAVQSANKAANTAANQADISKSLQENGFSEGEANDIASAIVAQYNGKSLTNAQEKLLDSLKNNAEVRKVISDIVENPQSTVGQRQQNIRDFQEDVRVGVISRSFGVSTEEAKKIVSAMFGEDTTAQAEAVNEDSAEVSMEGKSFVKSTGEVAQTVTVENISGKGNVTLTVNGKDGVPMGDVSFGDKATDFAFNTVTEATGMTPEAANVILSRPNATDIRFIEEALRAFQSGIQNDKLALSRLDPNAISKGDAERLFNLGRKAVEAKDKARDKTVAGGKTKRRKGIVKGEGVTISDLRNTFNDTQGMAYKYLSTVAEVTGIDIVLYRSVAGPDGKFQGAQGRYSRSEPGTIYIDLNAGLSDIKSADDLAKYAMLRTFAHEFTHFIENWNPIQYNELRKVVFDTLTQRGVNVSDLIEEKQTHNPGMDYDKASREVVAEAMTDILPDANFVQELAENHKNIFKKLFEKLNEFVENLRKYFTSIGYNPSREANALKEQIGETVKYLDNIVQLFDQAAVQAVENYQQAAVTAHKDQTNTNEAQPLDTATEDDVQYQERRSDRPNRRRALIKGEMINSFHNALSAEEWHRYYDRIIDGKYNPDLFEDNDLATVTVGNKLLLVQMQSNGEFSVKAVWFYQDALPPEDIIKEMKDYYAARNYGEDEIISWLSRIIGYDGQKLFLPYNRHSGQYDGAVQQSSASSENADGLLAETGSNGKRILEIPAGSDVAENYTQKQQRTNTLTSRDILSELPESVAQDDLELYILKKYQDQLGKVREQEQIQAKLNEDIKKLAPDQKEKLLQLQIELTKTKNRLSILNKNLKDTESAKPLGAILQREAPKILEKLRERYGTIPKGEKAVRNDALPVSTDGKNKVSRTARTVKGAAVTTDEFAGLIDTEVAKGELSYLPISNDAVTQKAKQYIQEEGWETAKARWSENVRQGKANAEMSAIGALLLNNAAQAGDRNVWLEILADYRLMGTRAAQAVQALRILKTLEPTDSLWMIQKSVEKMVRDLHLEGEVQINKDLIREYNAATTDKQRDAVIEKIQQDVALQLPSTMAEMWTALRYVNMLGNFKTQGRNILGNISSSLVHSVKDANAAILEAIVWKLSKGKVKRTKTLTVSRELLAACKADFAEVESLALDGGKYADAATSRLEKGIRDHKRVFKAPASVKNEKLRKALNAALTPLEWYRKGTNWATEAGDLWFSRSAYARSLAGYLKANGVKNAALANVDTALLDEARAYAIREAQEVTFRDHNALTEILTSRFAETTLAAKVANAVTQGIMPFRQTPANVLLRAEEYSPLGVINTFALTMQVAAGKTKLVEKKGLLGDVARGGQQITGTQLINSFAKTFTGTGLFLLGMIFSNLGWAVGGPDDDDQKDDFDKLNGKQDYSINFGGVSYTFDWLSPVSIPFFMGVTLMENIAEEGLSMETIADALMSITDPIIQMSMMQGVNRALDEIRYSDNSAAELGANALTSYVLQGVTNSLLSQIERGLEDKRDTTYTDKNKDLSTDAQYTLGQASAKIPGWDYSQIPFINAWGEEEKNPGIIANMAYNLFSPGYSSVDTTDAVAKELYRLNEVNEGDRGVFPSRPENEATFTDKDGVKHKDYALSAEEYVAVAKTQGQKQRKIVESMLNLGLYKDLPDNYKVKAIQTAYDYAREYAQIEELGRDGFTSDWMAGIQDNAAKGIVEHIIEENIKGMFLSGDISAAEAVNRRVKYCGDEQDQAAEKVAYWNFQQDNAKYEHWTQNNVTKYYDYAKGAKISVDTYDGYLAKKKGLKKKADILKVIDSLGLTDAQKDALYRAEGWVDSNLDEAPWHK